MIKYNIAKAWLKVTGITVIHSIPGRLRICFTGGVKAKNYIQSQKYMFESLFFYKLNGIEHIEFNPLTLKVLITYDPSLLKEKEIILWLSRLQELLVQLIIQEGKNFDQDIIDRIAARLMEEGYVLKKIEKRTVA